MGHVQSESVCAQCEHCSLQEQNCGGESCPLPRALSGGRDYFLDSNDFISRLSGTQVSPSLLVLRTRANTNVIKMPPACQRAAVGGNAGRAQIFSQFALGIANPRFPSCKRGTAALFGKEKPNCTAPAPRQTRKERRSRSGVTIFYPGPSRGIRGCSEAQHSGCSFSRGDADGDSMQRRKVQRGARSCVAPYSRVQLYRNGVLVTRHDRHAVACDNGYALSSFVYNSARRITRSQFRHRSVRREHERARPHLRVTQCANSKLPRDVRRRKSCDQLASSLDPCRSRHDLLLRTNYHARSCCATCW